jgi:hypothetical protein
VDRTADAAALAAGLHRLGADLVDAARRLDDPAVAALAARREGLVAALAATPPPAGAAGPVVAALREALALDPEVLGLLEARRAALRRALAETVARRRSLASYRCVPPDSDAPLVDRRG